MEKGDGIGAEPICTASGAYSALKQTINTLHLVYDVSPQELLEAIEQSGKDTFHVRIALFPAKLIVLTRLRSSQIGTSMG